MSRARNILGDFRSSNNSQDFYTNCYIAKTWRYGNSNSNGEERGGSDIYYPASNDTIRCTLAGSSILPSYKYKTTPFFRKRMALLFVQFQIITYKRSRLRIENWKWNVQSLLKTDLWSLNEFHRKKKKKNKVNFVSTLLIFQLCTLRFDIYMPTKNKRIELISFHQARHVQLPLTTRCVNEVPALILFQRGREEAARADESD